MNQNENNENAITLQQLNESPDFELSLEPETGSSAATPLPLSAESFSAAIENAIAIQEDTPIDDCICCPETESEKWYRFIPGTTKEYSIHTVGMLNSYGEIYDANRTLLAENNNYGIGLNFCMFATLTAGKTYYVRLCAVGDSWGNYTLKISAAVHPTDVTIDHTVLKLSIGEVSYMYPTVLPSNAPCKDIVWQSSDTAVVNVYPTLEADSIDTATTADLEWALTSGGCRVKGLANGIAYVTATTIDGRKFAQCLVVVGSSDVTTARVNTSDDLTLNLMESASASGTVLGEIVNGTELALINETPQNEVWYRVYARMKNGMYAYGWCLGEYLEKEMTFLKYVPTTGTTKVRNYYSTSDSDNIVGMISCGMQVELIQENAETNDGYTWHKIIYNDEIAYIAHFSGDYETVVRWVPLRCNKSAIVEDRFLTTDEKRYNAKIIYNYLLYKGWSKNAICGVIANMEAESSLSPGRWEMTDDDGDGDKAYGVLQWDPPTKWTNYADQHEYAYDNLYRQLDYFIYSTRYGGGEWGVSGVPTAYQLYAYEYAYSTRSVYDLAITFLLCYERPTDAETSVMNYRGNLAEAWKEYFDSIGW